MFSVILKEHNFLGVIITGKIKKILCLGLATVLAVGMTACGTKSAGDVYKLYKNGINSINNAVGIDLTTDTTMLATVGEESNETGYSSTLKKQNKDGDKQDTSITAVSYTHLMILSVSSIRVGMNRRAIVIIIASSCTGNFTFFRGLSRCSMPSVRAIGRVV